MHRLIGKEYCKVDANGRFKFPAVFKKSLSAVIDEGFVICESLYEPCLEIWPYKAFHLDRDKVFERLNSYHVEHRPIIRRLSEGNLVELDASDRILIPGDQRKAKKIDKDIVLISTNQCIEIWDVPTYDEFVKSGEFMKPNNFIAELTMKYLGENLNPK